MRQGYIGREMKTDAMRLFSSLYLATWKGRTTSRDVGVEGWVWWRSCVSEPGLPLEDDVPCWLWLGQSVGLVTRAGLVAGLERWSAGWAQSWPLAGWSQEDSVLGMGRGGTVVGCGRAAEGTRGAAGGCCSRMERTKIVTSRIRHLQNLVKTYVLTSLNLYG